MEQIGSLKKQPVSSLNYSLYIYIYIITIDVHYNVYETKNNYKIRTVKL